MQPVGASTKGYKEPVTILVFLVHMVIVHQRSMLRAVGVLLLHLLGSLVHRKIWFSALSKVLQSGASLAGGVVLSRVRGNSQSVQQILWAQVSVGVGLD